MLEWRDAQCRRNCPHLLTELVRESFTGELAFEGRILMEEGTLPGRQVRKAFLWNSKLKGMHRENWCVQGGSACSLCCVCVCQLLSRVQLCDSMDCSPPGSSVHGILQARILEWIAVPFSRGSSRPRDLTPVSHIVGRFFNN